MTHTMQRIALLALFSLFGGLFSLACHAGPQAYANTPVTAGPPACATDFALLQATTSTPARVSAAPGEHVALHMDHPLDSDIESGDIGGTWPPLNMYLLAGDAVEVIATCENYAYVRYQGARLVSAGWIEAGHVKYVGPRHVRPQDTVAQVCAAATTMINNQGFDASSLPYQLAAKLPKYIEGTRIMIGGRVRRVASVDDGGTCADNYLSILSDDSSHAIGSTDPIGGSAERLVVVLGHPLMMQSSYDDPKTFTLSSLDEDGHLIVICQATRVPTTMPRDISGSTNPVCRALVTNQTTAIPVHNVSEKFLSFPPHSRKYPSTSAPGPFALGVGEADLFNEGKPRDVGLASFHFHGGSGCGWTEDVTSPVILNAQGVADLNDATNKRLIEETTGSDELDNYGQASSGGRLITYAGSAYFVKHAEPVNTPTNDALVSVLRFTSVGSETVCRFQPYSFVVAPATGRAGQVVP
jgi:hypothetical protein